MSDPRIVAIGTLDTKGAEIAYVRDRIEALGGRPVVIDTGILGEPRCPADVTREDVARAAGYKLGEVQAAGSRGAAVELMQGGLASILAEMHAAGELDGALCLGGAEGALIGAAGMQALPVGVPKLIVSPSASGPRAFGPFVGRRDVTVMHSVIDILGLNPIARAVFDNAVAAVVGMARDAGRPVVDLEARSVGVTMLGQTTPGAMAACEVLEEAGWTPVIFHANGVGGPAMEDLIAASSLAGVIELSISELANSLFDGVHATDERRMTVAGEHGVPQVVTPGCADFFNQGALDTVPEKWRDRRLYKHNPVATLVRLSHDEMVELGRMIAGRLNDARGPVAVVAPTRGYSLIDVEGGPLWDHEADLALIETLERELRDGIPVERVDLAVNDPEFGRITARRFVEIAGGGDGAAPDRGGSRPS
ncbi:MAG TPA: Tm-1-like ATP-binding domain-containing protein [Solirubrobacterales bacterium]|nr:Tm-1-like ATP-binding domain-containing protein [Solirubrobacterales bacterium]